MAGITLAVAQEKLEKALAALDASMEGAGYSMASTNSSRSFQRQSPDALLRQVQYWQSQVNILSGRGSRIKYGIGSPRS